jgi:hypothetical protein
MVLHGFMLYALNISFLVVYSALIKFKLFSRADLFHKKLHIIIC